MTTDGLDSAGRDGEGRSNLNVWRLLTICVLLAQSTPVAACAICTCGDPTLTLMGSGRTFTGRTRFSAEFQRRAEQSKDSLGLIDVEEHRFDLGFSYAPAAFAQLAVRLPLVYRQANYAHIGRDRTYNLGDLELRTRLTILGGLGQVNRHLAGINIGLRAPTAPELLDEAGQVLPMDVQSGAGTWIPDLGGWYAYFNFPWSMYVNLNVAIPGEGFQRYRAGPAVLNSTIFRRHFGRKLSFQFGTDGRWSARSWLRGEQIQASGGYTFFASSGLIYAPATDLILHAITRVPFYDDRRGSERAGVTFLMGMTVDL